MAPLTPFEHQELPAAATNSPMASKSVSASSPPPALLSASPASTSASSTRSSSSYSPPASPSLMPTSTSNSTTLSPMQTTTTTTSSSSTSSPFKADWRHQDVAVLVSDLSGFTSSTRKYGIVHFASVILRMRQLVLPIFIEHYGALEITTEADNFITVFPTATAAVAAAIQMKGILAAYNETLLLSSTTTTNTKSSRQHFQIKLNGVGIACGKGVVMDNCGNHRLHGQVFRQAYHLGEDVCENGDILMTASVVDSIVRNADENNGGGSNNNESSLAAQLSVELYSSSSSSSSESVTEFDDRVFRVDFTSCKIPLTAKMIDYHDVTYLPKAFGPFVARHDPDADLEALDASILEQYSQTHVVLMHHLSQPKCTILQANDEEGGGDRNNTTTTTTNTTNDTTIEEETLRSVQAMERALKLLRPAIANWNGIECEEELFLFQTPQDAVLAVLEAKDAIEEYNLTVTTSEIEQVHIEGWGIHSGTMVVVPNTDIHWGDPVNTASKLGQDLATNSDFLISETIYEQLCMEDEQFQNVQFTRQELRYSGVDFTTYLVTKKQEGK